MNCTIKEGGEEELRQSYLRVGWGESVHDEPLSDTQFSALPGSDIMSCTPGYRFSPGGVQISLLRHCFETSQPKWLYVPKGIRRKMHRFLKGKNSFPITPINYRGHCGQNEWD